MLRKEERLEGVHPDLARVVRVAATKMPFDVLVLEGLRTREKQEEYVRTGASWTLDSRHLTGHAVDLAPVLDTDGDGDVEASWHWPHYYQLAPVMKATADELGVPVQWGGDWGGKKKDGPHWQLPKESYPS